MTISLMTIWSYSCAEKCDFWTVLAFMSVTASLQSSEQNLDTWKLRDIYNSCSIPGSHDCHLQLSQGTLTTKVNRRSQLHLLFSPTKLRGSHSTNKYHVRNTKSRIPKTKSQSESPKSESQVQSPHVKYKVQSQETWSKIHKAASMKARKKHIKVNRMFLTNAPSPTIQLNHPRLGVSYEEGCGCFLTSNLADILCASLHSALHACRLGEGGSCSSLEAFCHIITAGSM